MRSKRFRLLFDFTCFSCLGQMDSFSCRLEEPRQQVVPVVVSEREPNKKITLRLGHFFYFTLLCCHVDAALEAADQLQAYEGFFEAQVLRWLHTSLAFCRDCQGHSKDLGNHSEANRCFSVYYLCAMRFVGHLAVALGAGAGYFLAVPRF